jgi:hypothetical protein
MIPKPTITRTPKKTSYKITFLPCNRGSNNEVKNAPVERQAKVTEILETLIALKKVSQCNVIINPAKINPTKIFNGTLNGILFIQIKNKMKTEAIDILYQTNGTAAREIRAPSTAVKPQIKTMR